MKAGDTVSVTPEPDDYFLPHYLPLEAMFDPVSVRALDYRSGGAYHANDSVLLTSNLMSKAIIRLPVLLPFLIARIFEVDDVPVQVYFSQVTLE